MAGRKKEADFNEYFDFLWGYALLRKQSVRLEFVN